MQTINPATNKEIQFYHPMKEDDVEEALILCDKIYVLKGQPGEVVLTLDVDLAKEDFEEIIFSPVFLEYKRILLDALEN